MVDAMATRRRTRTGRFAKSSGARSRSRSTSTALTRRRTTSVAAAPRKRRAAAPKKRTIKDRLGPVAASAAWGFAANQTKILEKAPVVPKIGREMTYGIVAHMVAANSKGMVGKVADHFATGLLCLGAHSLAARGFSLEGDDGPALGAGEAAQLLNGINVAYLDDEDDDGMEISGEFDDAELLAD